MSGFGQKYNYDLFREKRTIQGIEITLPDKPPRKDIDYHNVGSHRQYFRPPDQKMIKSIDDVLKKDQRPSPEQVKFIKREWDRRLNGYWFFNNGNLEYITGLHYFYIAYWKIPVFQKIKDHRGNVINEVKRAGLPSFTDSDRDYFYIWNEVVKSDRCVGLLHITNRRDGKTYRATCSAYELMSRTYDSVCGIQSKTGKDAKNVFRKLVSSWQRLPEFWKPVDEGDSRPGQTLLFDEPKKRTTKTQQKDYADVLKSEITYFPATEEAMDGLGLAMSIADEVGKTVEADVAARWRIVRECHADGATVTGKGLLTTTVEEMVRKGGQACKEIWDDSDQEDLNKLGQTKSGLWRYFKPAWYGLRGKDLNDVPFIDKFGYSDIERTRNFLLEDREELSGKALSDKMRKYPFDIHEAFVMDTSHEVFPSFKIQEQLRYNETLPLNAIRRGNFIWLNEEKTKVSFEDDENGRWIISWLPKVEGRNKMFKNKAGHWEPDPTCNANGKFGVDSFDHNTTVDGRKSDGAFHGFRRFDASEPYHSNNFVCEYIHRPPKATMYYDDLLKTLVFYGWQALIENQKPGCINWLKDQGYGGYVMKTRQGDYTKSNSKKWVDGISTSGEMVREDLVNGLNQYIYDHVGKLPDKTLASRGIIKPEEDMFSMMYFDRTLNDWMKFDVNKWTDYDATVSSMLAKLAVKPRRKKIEHGNLDMPKNKPLFDKYTPSGKRISKW